MENLVEAGGMIGTPEAIAEFYALTDAMPGEVKTTPVDRLAAHHGDPYRRTPPRKPRKPRTRQNRNVASERGIPATAEEKRIAEFERKCCPMKPHKGKRWADIPVSYLAWFAQLETVLMPGGAALQVAVREYLDLKYGLAPGRLF